MTEQGPEPTGWELLRSLRDLKDEIAKVGNRVVPLDVYLVDKKAAEDRMDRIEGRQAIYEKSQVEADKLKRQQRLTISLAIGSPIIAFVLGIISGFLRPVTGA